MNNEPSPVTLLEEGEEGIVYSLSGGKNLTTRLAGMGISTGTRIKVLRNSGGLVVLLASDTRVALGKGEAVQILVNRTQDLQDKGEEGKIRKKLLVALAGQPNVGKSTVFNVLTGLSQHIGNWPGKTVEKKEGVHVSEDIDVKIVDLPGTYSLSAFSEEERIARDFIIHEHPDVIVLLVNAAALERSLYLLSELLLIGPPVVVAVNMIDIAEAQGIHVDINALQKSLRLPVVQMVATKNKGIKELVLQVIKLTSGELTYNPRMPGVSSDHAAIFHRLLALIREHVPPPYADIWVATKLMEGDYEISKAMEDLIPVSVWNEIQSLLIKHEDALRAVVGGRYDWVEEVTRAAISRFKRGQVLITDRIDHLLTRPIIGIPVLLGILGFIFLLTFKIGFPVQRWLEFVVSSFGKWLDMILLQTPIWVRGILVNGILGGVGSVLTFIPLLIIFFTAMAFLEDVGYMARAAFVMDRFMHVIGLHGKSFLPMCLGFGCNVPSILGARIVDSKRARLLTLFLTPFVPCTARLAVLTFVTATIFAEKGAFVSWSLIALNIIVLGIAGIIISRLFVRGEPIPFIMELPLYHKPDLRTIGIVVWSRIIAFVKKAGTVILGFSILIWIMYNIPGGNVEESILAWIGRFIQPVGAPLGLDWRMVVALVSSIVAKENSIATLGILYGVGDKGLMDILPRVIDHPSALAFLVVLMLFIPCAPTMTVMKQEIGNWRWSVASFVFMLLVSYGMGVVVYRFALFLGL